jgi:hypothetical protein
MARSPWTLLATLAALGLLPGCVVGTVDDTPAYAPAYSQASPYAAPAYAYSGAPAAVQPYDSYCAEAVGEAQSAAAQAAVTGSSLDVGRAQRSADYARRDC